MIHSPIDGDEEKKTFLIIASLDYQVSDTW